MIAQLQRDLRLGRRDGADAGPILAVLATVRLGTQAAQLSSDRDVGRLRGLGPDAVARYFRDAPAAPAETRKPSTRVGFKVGCEVRKNCVPLRLMLA